MAKPKGKIENLSVLFVRKGSKHPDKLSIDDFNKPDIEMNVTGKVDVNFMEELIRFIEKYDTTKTTSNAHAHKQRQSRKNPTISNNGMEKKKRGNL